MFPGTDSSHSLPSVVAASDSQAAAAIGNSGVYAAGMCFLVVGWEPRKWKGRPKPDGSMSALLVSPLLLGPRAADSLSTLFGRTHLGGGAGAALSPRSEDGPTRLFLGGGGQQHLAKFSGTPVAHSMAAGVPASFVVGGGTGGHSHASMPSTSAASKLLQPKFLKQINTLNSKEASFALSSAFWLRWMPSSCVACVPLLSQPVSASQAAP
jgi:hypothetical protein